MSSNRLMKFPAIAQMGPKDIIEGFKEVASSVKEIQAQQTERARLETDAKVEVERIHAMRDTLMAYLELSFDERKRNFASLFQQLDKAQDRGDLETSSRVLDSIVKLAESSPFKALKDPASVTRLLKDKGTEWVF